MKITKIIKSVDEMIELGLTLGKYLPLDSKVLLRGDLAAGKTTLTKGIAKGLEIESSITSPTFNIVKEYKGKSTLYHMDCYRLDGYIDEEIEEYYYSSSFCVIEWPDKIKEILDNNVLEVYINVLGETDREVIITSLDERYFCIQEVIE